MSAPGLSVVAPVFNEAGCVRELADRCEAAAKATGLSFELVFADDASSDATPQLLAELAAAGRVRHVRLEKNRGQFGATQAGLAAARGAIVVTLDGDLQDPPETIPALVAALQGAPGEDEVAFAMKLRRSDPLVVRLGSAGYHLWQRFFAWADVPSGAGAFTAMRSSMAARVAALPWQRSNIGAVLVALGARPLRVGYDKAARYDGRSRVGFKGLVREALASMTLTGALPRALAVPPAGLLGAAGWSAHYESWEVAAVLAGLAFVAGDGALTAARTRRRLLGLEEKPAAEQVARG
jgi:polyisoprenyl-phosphate glycosyltransferase